MSLGPPRAVEPAAPGVALASPPPLPPETALAVALAELPWPDTAPAVAAPAAAWVKAALAVAWKPPMPVPLPRQAQAMAPNIKTRNATKYGSCLRAIIVLLGFGAHCNRFTVKTAKSF